MSTTDAPLLQVADLQRDVRPDWTGPFAPLQDLWVLRRKTWHPRPMSSLTSCRGLTARRLVPLASLAAVLNMAGCAAEEGAPPASVSTTQAVPQQVVIEQAPAVQGPYRSEPGVTYSVVSPQPVGAAPITQVNYGSPPSLPYGEFLANAEDEGKRQLFWSLFNRAEPEARSFASTSARWVPIAGVEYGQPGHAAGDWSPSGVIVMKHENDPGVMFHEIFHPAFHLSEFHLVEDGTISHTDRDGAWSEAWCDGFRYYAERTYLAPGQQSGWVGRLERIMSQTESEALGSNGGGWNKRKYTYPASLIVKKAGGQNGSMATLHALWNQLRAMRAQRGAPVMDQFFGFVPPLHKRDM